MPLLLPLTTAGHAIVSPNSEQLLRFENDGKHTQSNAERWYRFRMSKWQIFTRELIGETRPRKSAPASNTLRAPSNRTERVVLTTPRSMDAAYWWRCQPATKAEAARPLWVLQDKNGRASVQ